jgi:hypothetical protein
MKITRLLVCSGIYACKPAVLEQENDIPVDLLSREVG